MLYAGIGIFGSEYFGCRVLSFFKYFFLIIASFIFGKPKPKNPVTIANETVWNIAFNLFAKFKRGFFFVLFKINKIMDEISFNDLPRVISLIYSKLEELEKLILANNVQQDPKVNDHVLMNTDEACNFLMMPKPTLYAKLVDGSIPSIKQGKRYYLYNLHYYRLNYI